MTRKISEFGSLAERGEWMRRRAAGLDAGSSSDEPSQRFSWLSEDAAPSEGLAACVEGIDGSLVRHVWLDGSIAALVLDRRFVDGAWQGLVTWGRPRS
ncbi:hypothetical protein [Tessaracoccus palaemonis]|uniref:Uncharacterized protein n=1 Tax=Tessaracoccus palaemonis TaxID=2829499 RepID=A0ABX8SGD6_9ACTN|nr:hypothetical protein [Tessaracoccus palaemonis]QXT62468.1 hypothetical protein KDB89_12050 [Tessaracoccus palaemonis]